MVLKVSYQDLVLALLYVGIAVFAILIIAAVVMFILKRIKAAKKYQKKVPSELKEKLMLAIGEDNIVDVKLEMSRVIIEVKDIDKVNAEELQIIGATNGVYLMGNIVKCSFGEKAQEIYDILKK